jgi:hypothetical protein
VKLNKRKFLIAAVYVSALLIFSCYAVNVLAASAAGTVTYLSGPLFVKKADGSIRSLAKNSFVEQGDTLITEKRTYTRIKFTDNSEVTLRPESQFKVEAFSYDQDKPEQDKALFELIKGGLRALSGHVGKRGDPDSYQMKIRSAVLGIRGTTFEVRICEGNCSGLEDGIYFFVPEGNIIIANGGESLTLAAGQHGYVKDINSKPKLLPGNPGIDYKLPAKVRSNGSNWKCRVR